MGSPSWSWSWPSPPTPRDQNTTSATGCYEGVGAFDFKGIAERAHVYRTCFGMTPVVRERVVLLQTNFVNILELADRHGWDTVHPLLDRMTESLLAAARLYGGTNRGTLQIGSFFTFNAVTPALKAVQESYRRLAEVRLFPASESVGLRVGMHFGTMHLMKHTMMGQDIDIVRTLSALGWGTEVLLTKSAVEVAVSEGLPRSGFESFKGAQMRECGSKRRWLTRYPEIELLAVEATRLPELAAADEGKQEPAARRRRSRPPASTRRTLA
jgi:hypothetical protein